MDETKLYNDLKAFAETRLNAAAYGDCMHPFDLWKCSQCGAMSFSVTIERDEHDARGDFHGIVRCACAACGHSADMLGMVTEGAARAVAVEHPRCDCGGDVFHAGMCERWESWGFFDEGTVVAMCTRCGAMRALVDTD